MKVYVDLDGRAELEHFFQKSISYILKKLSRSKLEIAMGWIADLNHVTVERE